jgi:hypothetical protein
MPTAFITESGPSKTHDESDVLRTQPLYVRSPSRVMQEYFCVAYAKGIVG